MTPVLCYVDQHTDSGFGFAYFTTQALANQWGDDWNDAPHNYNAGTPYGPLVYHYPDGSTLTAPQDFEADGTPKWTITRVAYYLPGFATPGTQPDEYLSVEQINNGAAPWLTAGDGRAVPAGVSLAEFTQFAWIAGGFAREIGADA